MSGGPIGYWFDVCICIITIINTKIIQKKYCQCMYSTILEACNIYYKHHTAGQRLQAQQAQYAIQILYFSKVEIYCV